ncbi:MULTISPECIES: DUF6069 family protein [Streptomyces]|uniref:Uncharacterized protein n=1 Tax=Streptomyces parvus TaxID=66428 RepID=A0A5D4JLP6_9ACTN|nr:DUF6069 family protein [Streptomyces parvus]TYR66397.1 hypothetical protein FY004_00955 [Streptomyces parvus]
MSSGTRAAQSSTATTSPVRLRAIAVVGGTVAALVVWGIGKASGAELEVIQTKGDPAMEVGFAAVTAAALFTSLIGWGVLALLEKFAPAKSVLIWTVLASAVAVLSIFPVLSAEASDGTKAVLPLVHLAVAAVVIPLMRRSAASSR